MQFSVWKREYVRIYNYLPNQSWISYKVSKKIYGKYLILSYILERIDSPKNIENFVSGLRDVGLIWPIYNVNSGKFEGLYKALGEMIVMADQKEVFLDYGFLKTL